VTVRRGGKNDYWSRGAKQCSYAQATSSSEVGVKGRVNAVKVNAKGREVRAGGVSAL
jgi:hypothetical protein